MLLLSELVLNKCEL